MRLVGFVAILVAKGKPESANWTQPCKRSQLIWQHKKGGLFQAASPPAYGTNIRIFRFKKVD
jgi:hypothetical protein